MGPNSVLGYTRLISKTQQLPTSWTGCQMDFSRALWDTMAPMIFNWNSWLGVVIECNFTGREAKQYSGEQGQ